MDFVRLPPAQERDAKRVTVLFLEKTAIRLLKGKQLIGTYRENQVIYKSTILMKANNEADQHFRNK